MTKILHPYLTGLLPHYDAILLDAYGVLVDKGGALPGAVALVDSLNNAGQPYFILTNSASRQPEGMAVDLQGHGLAVKAERILSSGLLLKNYFEAHALTGKPCLVLGPDSALGYVRDVGGAVVELGEDADAVIILDQAGYPLLETLDATLSLILRRLDRNMPVHLVLCNPDLIFPRAPGQYGITAGALAAMIEAVLRERYPRNSYQFVRLGKPYAPIFEEAARRAGSRKLLMIGDQLRTDILGARRFGIDSLLVLSGISKISEEEGLRSDYVLPGLTEGA